MKLIKIINGTYGYRPQPHVVERKNVHDAPFEVSDEEAARLVGLGVAEIAFGEDSPSMQDAMDAMVDQLEDQPVPPEDPDEEVPEEPEDEPEDDSTEEAESKIDPADLELLTVPQLTELAEELGIELTGRPKKAELISAILKATEEDDELPELGAADPEV